MNPTSSTIAIPEETKSGTPATYPAKAYAARSASSGLAQDTIKRRQPRPQDVRD